MVEVIGTSPLGHKEYRMQDVLQILGTFFCLRGRSKGARILPPAAMNTHLRVNVVRSSGFVGPGPGGLPSHLAGPDHWGRDKTSREGKVG